MILTGLAKSEEGTKSWSHSFPTEKGCRPLSFHLAFPLFLLFFFLTLMSLAKAQRTCLSELVITDEPVALWVFPVVNIATLPQDTCKLKDTHYYWWHKYYSKKTLVLCGTNIITKPMGSSKWIKPPKRRTLLPCPQSRHSNEMSAEHRLLGRIFFLNDLSLTF